MSLIKDNPVIALVAGIAVLVGSVVGIGKGMTEIDGLICTEAEAQEMIRQRSLPIQRQQ